MTMHDERWTLGVAENGDIRLRDLKTGQTLRYGGTRGLFDALGQLTDWREDVAQKSHYDVREDDHDRAVSGVRDRLQGRSSLIPVGRADRSGDPESEASLAQHNANSVAAELTPLGRAAELMRAMPDDPRGWWTGDEVDEFLSAWSRAGMPEATTVDVTWVKVTVWTDLQQAATMLGMEIKDSGYGPHLELQSGEYTVGIVPSEK